MANSMAYIGVAGTKFEDDAPKFAKAVSGIETAYATILEVASGSGFLICVSACPLTTDCSNVLIKITIDGTLELDAASIANAIAASSISAPLSCIHRFNSSLKVEASAIGSTTALVIVAYTLE